MQVAKWGNSLTAVQGLLGVHPVTIGTPQTGLEIAERYSLSV